jgi:hypothetical protein
MGVTKERSNFLKWRKDNFPLLRTDDSESHMMWMAWQGRADLDIEKCPRCNGIGFVPTDMNRGGKCWLCKGKGTLKKGQAKKLKFLLRKE